MMNNKLGIDFGFQEDVITSKLKDFYPEMSWSKDKVLEGYKWYREGILEFNLPPIKTVGLENAREIADFIKSKSSLSPKEVNQFIAIMQMVVRENLMDPKYLSVQKPQNIFTQKVKKSISEISPESYFKNIKFIGIIALVGVGLYFSWPVLKKIRNRIK